MVRNMMAVQELSDPTALEKAVRSVTAIDGAGEERMAANRGNRSRAKSLSVGDLRIQNRGTHTRSMLVPFWSICSDGRIWVVTC